MIDILNTQIRSFKLLIAMNFLLGVFFCFGIVDQVSGQEKDSVSLTRPDTTKQSVFTKRLQKVGSDGYLKSKQEFEVTKIEKIQRSVLSQIKSTVQEAKMYLAAGFDSLRIEKDLTLINTQKEIVEKGVFDNEVSLQSDRNLAVSRAILFELSEKATSFKENIENRSQELVRLSYQIDSLSTIEEIYLFPSDSLLAISYANKFVLLGKEIEPTINALNYTLNSLDKLQSKTDELLITLQASILDIERRREALNEMIFSKEVFNLTNSGYTSLSFWEVVKISHEKEFLALKLYFQIYSWRFILMFVFFLLLTAFIHNVKTRAREEALEEDPDNQQLVLKKPFLASLIIIIGIFQFFFPNPPFVFYFLIWMIAGISLTVLFKKFLSNYWITFWIVVLVVFFISNSISLLLVFTQIERIAILALASIGVFYGGFLLLGRLIFTKELKLQFF
jgi:hypothetical protein